MTQTPKTTHIQYQAHKYQQHKQHTVRYLCKDSNQLLWCFIQFFQALGIFESVRDQQQPEQYTNSHQSTYANSYHMHISKYQTCSTICNNDSNSFSNSCQISNKYHKQLKADQRFLACQKNTQYYDFENNENINNYDIPSSITSLFNGVAIAKFIDKIQNNKLNMNQIDNSSIYKAGIALRNFKIIVDQVDRYINQEFCQNNNVSLDNLRQIKIKQICTSRNCQQLIKILNCCFILATRATNNSYFIQKILTLSQNTQSSFAQMIKRQCANSALSPTRSQGKSINSDSNHSSPNCVTNSLSITACKNAHLVVNSREYAVQLIDRMYQLQMQNTNLNNELIKYKQKQCLNSQQLLDLQSQLASIKYYNESLKLDIQQKSSQIQKLKEKSRKDRQKQKQKRKQQYRKQFDQLINTYKQEIQILQIKAQTTKSKFEIKVSQLQYQCNKQRQYNDRLKQQLQYYQVQMQNFIVMHTQIQNQYKQLTKQLKNMQKQSKRMQEQSISLKFDLNYKNSQIQQLKQLLVQNVNSMEDGIDIQNQRNSCSLKDQTESLNSYSQSKQLNNRNSNNFISIYSPKKNMELNRMRSSNRLTLDHDTNNILQNKCNYNGGFSSPNLRISIKSNSIPDKRPTLYTETNQQQQEVVILRKQVKYLKNNIRQLQYEQSRLNKIVKEYYASRGEQNQIITGCLFQLHKHIVHMKQNDLQTSQASYQYSHQGNYSQNKIENIESQQKYTNYDQQIQSVK